MVGALLMRDVGPNITYENLKTLFEEFKTIFISIIGQDCAYIIFSSREEALKACEKFNRSSQFGRLIKLDLISYISQS